MRRYDIVSGILLILSIINFVLAAPVIVQEKRQEYAGVVHISKDVETVLGKRWEEGLEKLGEEFLKTGGKSVESSDSTLSSSLAPSGSDRGSTNVMQPPAPSPASPTANPDPLTEPSSCSASSVQGLRARGNCMSLSEIWSALNSGDVFRDPLYDPTSGYNFDHELTGAHAPQMNPNPNPNPNPTPSIEIDPSADPDFDWNYWTNVEDPPLASPRPLAASPRPLAASPKGFGQADWYKVDPKNPPSTSGYAPSPTGPEPEVVTPSSPKLESLKEPEGEVVPGPAPTSSPVDSQPVDLQAAIYAAKGKAKESRRISGTARDVMNAELQPEATTERSLDSESGENLYMVS